MTAQLPFHRLQLKALQDVRAPSQLMDSQPDVAVVAEVVAVGLPHRVRAVDLEVVGVAEFRATRQAIHFQRRGNQQIARATPLLARVAHFNRFRQLLALRGALPTRIKECSF